MFNIFIYEKNGIEKYRFKKLIPNFIQNPLY